MGCNWQDKRPLMGKTEYQRALNASYKDASKSPLKKKDLKKFKGLDFFPIDSTFIVTAKLTKIANIIQIPSAMYISKDGSLKKYQYDIKIDNLKYFINMNL